MDKVEVDKVLMLIGDLDRQRFEERRAAIAMGLSMMISTRG